VLLLCEALLGQGFAAIADRLATQSLAAMYTFRMQMVLMACTPAPAKLTFWKCLVLFLNVYFNAEAERLHGGLNSILLGHPDLLPCPPRAIPTPACSPALGIFSACTASQSHPRCAHKFQQSVLLQGSKQLLWEQRSVEFRILSE
jgi:hypothetical protein